MKIKSTLSIISVMLVGSAFASSVQYAEVIATMNREKVILPSTTYTPDEPYLSNVWVFNEGTRYEDRYYNYVWAAPAADNNGREWYEPDYKAEDAEGWEMARAPYSSDEYYMGQKSYQWITSDITGDIYIRRSFTLNSHPSERIFLACGHDDAPAEWYINGELVHSVADGWDNNEYVLLSGRHMELLKTDGSENIMAVHVHQNWGGAFADCGLYGADMTRRTTLLNTVADGAWPCKYYMLNYNSDIPVAEAAGWAAESEDESDWIECMGPLSNDYNMFLRTEWPSQVRPILVRRHFYFSAEDIAAIGESEVTLACSYDENPKVYLNGTLIWSATGWNDNDYAMYNLTESQKALLHEGDNVLAVSLSQGDGGGHIDYGLYIVAPYITAGITQPEADKAPMAADDRVFNLQGHYLGTSTDNLPKGMYIVGGKKVVIK